MGTAQQARRDRRSDKQVLKDFGIDAMAESMQELATTVTATANRQIHLEADLKKKHDELVKVLGKELHKGELRVDALVEVRNRGFWGRVKWLATGK